MRKELTDANNVLWNSGAIMSKEWYTVYRWQNGSRLGKLTEEYNPSQYVSLARLLGWTEWLVEKLR